MSLCKKEPKMDKFRREAAAMSLYRDLWADARDGRVKLPREKPVNEMMHRWQRWGYLYEHA